MALFLRRQASYLDGCPSIDISKNPPFPIYQAFQFHIILRDIFSSSIVFFAKLS